MGQLKNKNLNKTLGNRVSGARHNAGFATSADFAAKCDIDHQTIRSIECGSVTVNAATLKTLAEKLGVSADYLLGLSEIKTPDPDIRWVAKKYGLSEDALTVLESLKDEDSKAEQEMYDATKEMSAWVDMKNEMGRKNNCYDKDFVSLFGCYSSSYNTAKHIMQRMSALNTILSNHNIAVDILDCISQIVDFFEMTKEIGDYSFSFPSGGVPVSSMSVLKACTGIAIFEILERALVSNKPTKAPKTDA